MDDERLQIPIMRREVILFPRARTDGSPNESKEAWWSECHLSCTVTISWVRLGRTEVPKQKSCFWVFLFFLQKIECLGTLPFNSDIVTINLTKKSNVRQVKFWKVRLCDNGNRRACALTRTGNSHSPTSRECSLVILHWRIPSTSVVPCSFLVWTLGRSGLRSHCLAASLITCRIYDFQY